MGIRNMERAEIMKGFFKEKYYTKPQNINIYFLLLVFF